MIKESDLGKPAGISLADHTQHVIDEAEYVIEAFKFACDKYKRLTSNDLRSDLLEAAKYHDWGKADRIWQDACKADYQLYRDWRVEKGYDPAEINPEQHRTFENEMRKQNKLSSPNIFKAGLRHEFASLRMVDKAGIQLSNLVKAAIAAHHGKLSYTALERWKQDGRKSSLDTEGPYFEYWRGFKQLSFLEKKLPEKDLLVKRYQFAAVRSLLRLADTRASRKEGEGEEADYKFAPFEFNFKYEPRPVQQAALDIAKEPISILRAPTGSGKTFASLLWTKEQINAGKADRLVVAMPTRFTSNALSISVADEMGETGLYHSSAWFNRYGEIDERKKRNDAQEAHRMAKYLATPVTVCTVDHLLISLTGVKEDHHATFFLANSCVVFDEADFYDPFVQANLVVLLDALRTLEVPVLIMSATVPDSARELYKVDAEIKVPNEPTIQNVKKLEWLEPSSEKNEEWVMYEMLRQGNGIIYANTVERALKYYKWFTENKAEVPLIMYHSRFTEPGKKDIEERLIAMLGKEAWSKHADEPVRGIAIMTQIGEMSVNISSPLMLSDLCPWDRLAQRIGRLVRFDNQGEGMCYIVEPQKNGSLYPAPYGEYDRGKRDWKAVPALLDTRSDLQMIFLVAKPVIPDELVDFVNKLYPKVPEFDSTTKTNQSNYLNLIKDNWLIQPAMETDEEDVTVADQWSSRHIPPQVILLISDEMFFSDFSNFQNHVLEYGVSCPVYQIEKEMKKKNPRIEAVTITIQKGDIKKRVYTTRYYSETMGLSFLYENDLPPDASGQVLV